MDKLRIKELKEELVAVGIKSKTLLSLGSKSLAKILYDGEHIGGAIHGTYSGGLAWLIATNKRVIFMDRKPLFTTIDEISYDVVSGTKSISTLSKSVTLHTRVGDYIVNFVEAGSAKTFVSYIEKMIMSVKNISQTKEPNLKNKEDRVTISPEARDFLRLNGIGVLSTIDRIGEIHGAVVNYLIDKDNSIYILTRAGTSKGRNIFASPRVAFTVFDENKLQTAQIQGNAEIETNQANKDDIHDRLARPRNIKGEMKLPPVTKLQEGEFMVIKIRPTSVKYHDYS